MPTQPTLTAGRLIPGSLRAGYWRCWVLAACAMALLLPVLAAGPAFAEDDDDELTFEQRMIRNLLGGGRGAGIDYRERSPLVIPPGENLPVPETGAGPAANAAWPKDPDQARARPAGRRGTGPLSDQIRDADRPLSPRELRAGARAGAGRNEGPVMTESDGQLGRPLTPKELGETRSIFGLITTTVTPEKPATFTKEPTRERLTQPPAGYQTPAGNQAYAPPSSKGSWFGSIPSFFDRHTMSKDR